MNRHLNRGANLFLLILGMLSLCLLLQQSFDLILPSETYLWLALLCFLLWIATAFRYGLLIGMPLSGALLIFLYQEKSVDLVAEMRDFLDHINNANYGHYSGSGAALTAEGFSGNHEFAILLIFFILTAFVSVSLHSGSFRVSLIMLATMPIFAICVAINGTPRIMPIIGLLLFWAGIQLGGDAFRPDDGAGKALLFGLLPCLLVLSALLLLYRPDTYVPTEYDISLSQRFDKLGNALTELLGESGDTPQSLSAGTPKQTVAPEYRAPNGWDRGRDDLDLTASFDISKLNDEAFHVSSDSVGSLYLRGRSYGEYNGTSWSAAVENTHGNALSYVGNAIAGDAETVLYSFQLQSPVIYDVLYLPYYSISDSSNDVLIPADGLSNYSGSFYLTSIGADQLQNSVQLPSQLYSDELQYREFAHSYYTRLPDSTQKALAEICQEQNFSPDQSSVIWSIADFVRRQGIYDVNVEQYPSSDYAVWFLIEAHRGYCIHFATSAVALYRSLGIPARVCEGYLVNNTSPGMSVRVTGSDAHAWAEVYLDGIGWIPVEVTASASPSPDQPSQGSTAPTPEPTFPENTPDEPRPEQNEEIPSGNRDNDNSSGESDEGYDPNGGSLSESGSGSEFSHAFLTILAALTSITAIFFGRYFLLRALLRRRLSVEDANRRAVYYYRQAEKVMRYGGEIPGILLETAEKARFSQHEITSEELLQCESSLNSFTEEVASGLNSGKKFFFRFLSGNQ